MRTFKFDGGCVPLALQYLTGNKPSSVATACFSAGMDEEDLMQAAKKLKIKLVTVETQPIEVRKFIRKYPEGQYIVFTHNHCFVIDNGVPHDPLWDKPGLRRKINKAWKVE